MSDHVRPPGPTEEEPSSPDAPVQELPEQDDLEAQILAALTPAELQEALRPIPSDFRQQLLSKLRIAGARTPTVLQCRQILATLERTRKAHHMFLHSLAIDPAFYLRHAADRLKEEGRTPAAAFRGGIDELLEEGRAVSLVRLGAYDMAVHSGKDLCELYMAVVKGHPRLRLPDWPDAPDLDVDDEKPLDAETPLEGLPDGLKAHLAELRALSTTAQESARELLVALDEGAVPALEVLDPIWDALYRGWELLEDVREASLAAGSTGHVEPTLDGIARALEVLGAPDPTDVALARLAFINGPDRSSRQCDEIQRRARLALGCSGEVEECAGLVPLAELIDAVAADADYHLIDSKMHSTQSDLESTLSPIIAPAMQGRLVLPTTDDPRVQALLATTPPPAAESEDTADVDPGDSAPAESPASQPEAQTRQDPPKTLNQPASPPEPSEASAATQMEEEVPVVVPGTVVAQAEVHVTPIAPATPPEPPPAPPKSRVALPQPGPPPASIPAPLRPGSVDEREVTREESAGQGEDDERSQAVQDKLAEALESGRYGRAYWLAVAADHASGRQSAFATAAYADAMRTATGECAVAFQDASAAIDLDAIDADRPAQIVVLSAALRAALLAPYGGAGQVLGSIRPAFADNDEVDEIIGAVIRSGQAGLQLVADVLPAAQNMAATEQEVEEASHRARMALSRGPNRKAMYQGATNVWNTWMAPNGVLGELLEPAAKNDRRRLAYVREGVVRLRSRNALERAIDDADRRVPRRRQIQYRAKEQLLLWGREALDVAANWVEAVSRLTAVGTSDGESERRQAILGDLREVIRKARPGCEETFAAWSVAFDPLEAAAAAGGLASLRATFELLDGMPLPGVEPPARQALNTDLLFSAEILLDAWEPIRPPELDELLVTRSESWRDAFETRSSAGDHIGTDLIIAAIRTESPELAETLEAERAKAVAIEIDSIESLRRAVGFELARDRRHGYLDEDAWIDLSSTLDTVTPLERFDFGSMRSTLEDLRQRLSDIRDVAVSAFRTQFDEQRARDPRVARVAERIESRLAAGDLATAQEYLSNAAEGAELEAPDAAAMQIDQFFPQLAREIAGRPFDGRIVSAARDGQIWGPLDFSTVDQRDRDRVAEGLAAWLALSDGPVAQYKPAIVPFLSLLGMECNDRAQRAPSLDGTAERAWVDLTGFRRNGKAFVPHFGSTASGTTGTSLRLLLAWGEPKPAEISAWLDQDRSDRSHMLLYFGILSEQARRELANCFRAQGRSHQVAIVDSALIAYAASLGNRDYSTTMRLTLPFASVNPYDYAEGPSGIVPEEMFYGRTEEIDSIVRPRGACFLYGGRQLGKSALLREVRRRHDDGSNFRVLYADLKGAQVGYTRGAEAVWEVLWEELTSLGVGTAKAAPRDLAAATRRSVRAWLAASDHRRILVLLDECDAMFAWDARFEFPVVSQLKELMDSTERRFKIVFAGLHKVQRSFRYVENQPLTQLGQSLSIGPLRPRDAANLAARPMEAAGYRFEPPEVIARIIAVCNNQPSLIVLFMGAVVKRLLDSKLGRAEPPVVIDDADVEATDASPDLREQIKERFELTLDLDPSYKVIAYTMAYLARLQGPAVLVPAGDLRLACAENWPRGFGVMSVDAFRTLCDEMVGLGVLATSDGCYRLRSPNVLRLLGSEQAIIDTLVDVGTLEPADKLEPATLRPALPTGSSHSPLTVAQLLELLNPRPQVRVVLGSDANRIDLVEPALRAAARADTDIAAVDGKLRGMAGALTPPAAGRHKVVVIHLGAAPATETTQIMELALDRIHRAKERALGIIVVAGPAQTGLWHDLLVRQGVLAPMLEVRRWDAAEIRAWVRDADDMPFGDESEQAELLGATGGWAVLLERVRAAVPTHGGAGAIRLLREELTDPEKASQFVTAVGLHHDARLTRSFEALCLVLPDGEAAPAAVVASVLAEEMGEGWTDDMIDSLRMLGALASTPEGMLRPEPVLAAAWQLAAQHTP